MAVAHRQEIEWDVRMRSVNLAMNKSKITVSKLWRGGKGENKRDGAKICMQLSPTAFPPPEERRSGRSGIILSPRSSTREHYRRKRLGISCYEFPLVNRVNRLTEALSLDLAGMLGFFFVSIFQFSVGFCSLFFCLL